MKVGIDGRLLFRNITGQERYVWNLCSHLKNSPGATFVLYTTSPFPQIEQLRPRFSESVIGVGPKLAGRVLSCEENIDLYHLCWPGYTVMDSLLLLLMPRSIYTPHDLVQYKNPQYFPSRFAHERYRQMISLSCRWADKVITVSNHSRRDIIETLKIPPDKVKVIYEGVDPKFKVIDDRSKLEKVRKKFELKGRLIFNLATDYPHKNAGNLIRAFSELSRTEDEPLELIIAGQRYDRKGSEEISRLLEEVPYRENIRWLNHLADDDILSLYNIADVFVNPSLFEGFGLTVLEAMACGAPVVVSDATSLPEVAGDAALTVDARDVEEIVQAVKELLHNPLLRNSLIEKGFKQVERFSWERTARETQSVYEDVCRTTPARGTDGLPEPMKQWLRRHLVVAAGMEEEIGVLSARIDRIDARLARLRASVPGQMYRTARRAVRRSKNDGSESPANNKTRE